MMRGPELSEVGKFYAAIPVRRNGIARAAWMTMRNDAFGALSIAS
jgi:hypothetical protein